MITITQKIFHTACCSEIHSIARPFQWAFQVPSKSINLIACSYRLLKLPRWEGSSQVRIPVLRFGQSVRNRSWQVEYSLRHASSSCKLALASWVSVQSEQVYHSPAPSESAGDKSPSPLTGPAGQIILQIQFELSAAQSAVYWIVSQSLLPTQEYHSRHYQPALELVRTQVQLQSSISPRPREPFPLVSVFQDADSLMGSPTDFHVSNRRNFQASFIGHPCRGCWSLLTAL